LPIVNHLLKRMKLQSILQEHLPQDDRRMEISTTTGLLVLLRNVLLSREPMYAVAEWAERYAPDLLGLSHGQLNHLNDDRLGRCLDRLFDTTGPDLLLHVVRHVVREFDVSLDELHNDSTTLSFFGAYKGAEQESHLRSRPTIALTHGHSKDHRPDLKQLLYILTISEDGGVPVYFTSASGNVTDDQTHRETWDLLCELVGRPDFLYVADCKLATSENMNYVARRQGRFVTVLPRTRKEDAEFRRRLVEHPNTVSWTPMYEIQAEEGFVIDRLSQHPEGGSSAEGYRLLWFHSTRKAEQDAAKVEEALAELLQNCGAGRWLNVEIQEREEASYKQATRGRPGKQTQYVKQAQSRFDLRFEMDVTRVAEDKTGDGVFPLVSNADDLSAEALLRAYKRQPFVEKRFSQFKTDYEVAPVYLKEVSRIQALLCVYFFALLVQTLLERELRQAMRRGEVESLPLYPEGRSCRQPTTRRVLDVLEPVQRHQLTRASGPPEVFVTDLTPVHRQILKLIGLSPATYGH
jgi:transposase